MTTRAKCCYTHLIRKDRAWREADYSIKKFVDAIKGRPIRDYAHLRVLPDEPLRQLEQANAVEAFEWFGEMAAELIRDEGLARPVLIPFPDSKCSVSSVEPPRTLRLATAVERYLGATVADLIRFSRGCRSAHAEGGTREPAEIYGHLRLIGPFERGRPYVLIDDVLASGGHARAAVAFLRAHDADVRLVVCAVSAESEPATHPFGRVDRTLSEFDPRSVRTHSTNPAVDLVLEPGHGIARDLPVLGELASLLQSPNGGP